jgi:hypothetical protein
LADGLADQVGNRAPLLEDDLPQRLVLVRLDRRE